MSKTRIVSLLLLLFLSFGTAERADAQFLKKLFGRGKKHNKKEEPADKKAGTDTSGDKKTEHKSRSQRKKEKKERKEKEKLERKAKKESRKESKREKKKKKGKKTADKPAEQTVIRKWADIDYPSSERKTHYRIDILAPLYLDELVKNGYVVKDIPEKAAPGLNFYKGIQIAADTLKKAHFDIDIYVHDVSTLLESSEMLVNKHLLDSSDLIIGATAPKDIPVLAAYAKRKQLNFISALSPSDGGVKDNPYFTLIQPSMKSQCEWITREVERIHTQKMAVMLYRPSAPADDMAYKFLNADSARKTSFVTVPCTSIPPKAKLAALFDTTHTNVIVMAINDINFADSLLKTLKQYFPTTRFEVYGMPTWVSMLSLQKPGVYPNFSINFAVPFYYDPASDHGKYVERIFKKEYGGRPGENVFRGYETLFWYANMLQRYGTIFNKQYSDNETSPFTKFEVKPQWDASGNVIYQENRHVVLRKYENGTSSVVR